MPPVDTNISPEQAAARAEAMKRIEQFGMVQTTNSEPDATSESAPPAPAPEAPPTLTAPPSVDMTDGIAPIVAPELATPGPETKKSDTTSAASNSDHAPAAPASTDVAAITAELQAEKAAAKANATTVLTNKNLPPIAKSNAPLPDELSLVNRIANYFFEGKSSWYLKSAILFGVLAAVYIVILIIGWLTKGG